MGRYTPHKHDMHKSPTYKSWIAMRQRCYNPKIKHWNKYGGRGISICKRWDEFENFLADMGEKPEGKSLDRIDVNGNYEPDNCRWATQKTQQRNRRDNNTLTYQGETLTLQAWSEKTGITFEALRGRYRKGWPAELALTLPVTKANSVLRKLRTYNRDVDGKFIEGGK